MRRTKNGADASLGSGSGGRSPRSEPRWSFVWFLLGSDFPSPGAQRLASFVFALSLTGLLLLEGGGALREPWLENAGRDLSRQATWEWRALTGHVRQIRNAQAGLRLSIRLIYIWGLTAIFWYLLRVQADVQADIETPLGRGTRDSALAIRVGRLMLKPWLLCCAVLVLLMVWGVLSTRWYDQRLDEFRNIAQGFSTPDAKAASAFFTGRGSGSEPVCVFLLMFLLVWVLLKVAEISALTRAAKRKPSTGDVRARE